MSPVTDIHQVKNAVVVVWYCAMGLTEERNKVHMDKALSDLLWGQSPKGCFALIGKFLMMLRWWKSLALGGGARKAEV